VDELAEAVLAEDGRRLFGRASVGQEDPSDLRGHQRANEPTVGLPGPSRNGRSPEPHAAGLANYFREGTVSAAYRIVDAHACFRLRQWLGRRERVQGSSRSRYSEPYLRRTYGLVKLVGRRRQNS